MANSIDLIIGQEAIKQVENLISKLSLADAELIKISQSASIAGKGINGISTPSGLDKSIGSTASLNAELEKQNAIIDSLTKKIDALAKKRDNDNTSAKNTLRALEQETKSRQALQTQKDKAIAQANKEQAIAEKNANTYNKTQAQINRLTTSYNDLSVRKARYNNLNENEEKRLGTLSAINEKYNGILKQTDATIGKNQRNVGNYASGYNALGNSINQLTREAPAFANSVNTGFMAISNNIPALFDAIKGIRVQNQALASEGKPTVSVLKSLAGALFSWGTLLSVGVTLLTLYGGELVKWVSNAMKGKEAINSIKISQEGLNKAFEESSVKDAVKNVNELTTNIDLAKKGIISKESVVNQYN
jgi:DNA repair exonuclease SbcCD ATPase subunit